MTEEKRAILFKNEEHRKFMLTMLPRCREADCYHMALVYCLGLSRDTRKFASEIFDFESGMVQPECLARGWMTSGSARIVRMAFNLFTGGTPSVDEQASENDMLTECSEYSAADLFCCSDAPYFWQAIQLRYPEYC